MSHWTVDVRGLDHLGVELVDAALDVVLVDVRHRQTRASLVELFGEVVAHMSHTLNCHVKAVEIVAIPAEHGRGLDAASHTQRSQGRWITRGPRIGVVAKHAVCVLFDDRHVTNGRSAVFTGDVAATQRIHKLAKSRENVHALSLGHPFGTHNDGLSAAVWQSRDRRLVRHAATKAHGVAYRGEAVRILDESTAADRRSEFQIVDRHNRMKPRLHISFEVKLAKFEFV